MAFVRCAVCAKQISNESACTYCEQLYCSIYCQKWHKKNGHMCNHLEPIIHVPAHHNPEPLTVRNLKKSLETLNTGHSNNVPFTELQKKFWQPVLTEYTDWQGIFDVIIEEYDNRQK